MNPLHLFTYYQLNESGMEESDLEPGGITIVTRLPLEPRASICPSEKLALKDNPLLYGMDESPPWYMCLTMGFQVRDGK